MEAGRMDSSGESERDDHDAQRRGEYRVWDETVLVAVGGAVHERDGGDWNHRAGFADDSGIFQGCDRAGGGGRIGGFLGLFYLGGRFFWSSVSDYIGRKPTYFIFFALGAALYFLLPLTGADHLNSIALFVGIAVILLSMYGGGFATIPAYLRDMFGVFHVSAIHGRLLTAWSTAGVLGPVLVNYLREYQIAHGADKSSAYQSVLHVMAGLLVVGFVANLMVRPVEEKYWMHGKGEAPAGAGGGH